MTQNKIHYLISFRRSEVLTWALCSGSHQVKSRCWPEQLFHLRLRLFQAHSGFRRPRFPAVIGFGSPSSHRPSDGGHSQLLDAIHYFLHMVVSIRKQFAPSRPDEDSLALWIFSFRKGPTPFRAHLIRSHQLSVSLSFTESHLIWNLNYMCKLLSHLL